MWKITNFDELKIKLETIHNAKAVINKNIYLSDCKKIAFNAHFNAIERLFK